MSGAGPVSSTAMDTVPTRAGLLPGFGSLLRKDLLEWRRGRRLWVVLIVTTLFMTLTALNAWLQASFAPPGGLEGAPPPVLDPLTNVLAAVSSLIFVVVAVFASMSLIVSERESGTLAWTASKPVSRGAIWLSKFVSATLMLWLAAALLPLAATVALVVALYGSVPLTALPLLILGMGMAIALFVAITLAASTVINNQAGVAAIGLAALFLAQLLGVLVPPEFLPTSILQWSIVAAAGGSAGFVTVISWAVTVAVLIAFAMWRMDQLEL